MSESHTYAVADLHGRDDLLRMAVDAITARGGGKVVLLGDYVDRGPGSRQIIETLMAGPPVGQSWVVLKGNHEDMMVQVCRGQSPVKWWLGNGGGQTLVSYGHEYEVPVSTLCVPPAHLDWIHRLPLIHVDAHRVYVHAGVDPTIPLDEQTERTLLWKLYPDHFAEGHGERHVVHGHHQFADGPLRYAGRTDLDTLAWYTGRLVIGVFDDARPGGPIDTIEIRGPSMSALAQVAA